MRVHEMGAPTYLTEAVAEEWMHLIVTAAGPLADMRCQGMTLNEPALRQFTPAKWDLEDIDERIGMTWPYCRRDARLRSCNAAIRLIRRPDVWTAVKALAQYVADHRTVDAPTIDVVVRRHLPQPIPLADVPGLAWAMKNANVDFAAARRAGDGRMARNAGRKAISSLG
jgi:hypothetical protein